MAKEVTRREFDQLRRRVVMLEEAIETFRALHKGEAAAEPASSTAGREEFPLKGTEATDQTEPSRQVIDDLKAVPWPDLAAAAPSTGARVSSANFRPMAIRGEDERTPVSQLARYPYNAICFIDAGSETGTGCLLGPRCVLTAGHVITNGRAYVSPRSVRVDFERAGSRVAESAQGAHVWAPPEWLGGNELYDYGLIFLDRDIARRPLPFAHIRSDVEQQFFMGAGQLFNVAGYPGYGLMPANSDLVGYHMFQHVGRIERIDGMRLQYLIDTVPGNSGAPMIQYDGAASHVVGVHVGTLGATNRAVRIFQQMFDQLLYYRGRSSP